MPEGLGTVGKYTTQETSHKLKKTRRKKDAIYRSNNESQCLIGWLDLNTAMLEKNKQQPCTNEHEHCSDFASSRLGAHCDGDLWAVSSNSSDFI